MGIYVANKVGRRQDSAESRAVSVAELSADQYNAALVDESGVEFAITAAQGAVLSAVTASAAELNSLDFDAIEARTATETGATTGTIAGGRLLNIVAVTSANAAHIVILPAPTPGTIVVAYVGANGYELRSSAPGTVAIGGGAEAGAESAIPAASIAVVFCTSATTWVGFTITAATLAAIEAAAAA